MKETFNLPPYRQIVYSLSLPAGHYFKNDLQPGRNPAVRFPNELKRIATQAAKVKCNSKEVLILPEYENEKGPKKLLTGINETLWANWFIGEHRRRNNGVKINSLLLIHFTKDNRTMSIFFFSGYHIEPDQQQGFSANAIPVILRAHFM